MKLIVGLGNPGRKFDKTRHNLGFLAVDILANSLSPIANRKEKFWTMNEDLRSAICDLQYAILAKPQTFVNQAGIAVKKIVDFYKLTPTHVLIVRDDIDLPRGKIRGPKNQTGSGGHLGVESIKGHLASDEFYQLKIGVGRPPANVEPQDFVLEPLSRGEWNYFSNLLANENGVAEKIRDWIAR